MKILDAFLDALRSIKSNTMRSVLTTLGIIIGVGAVIIMVSVGNGAKEQINEMIDKLGANIMMVMPGRSFGRGVSGSVGSLPTLTEDDAWAIQNEIPVVKLVAPFVRGSAQLISGNLNWSTTVQGVTNEYFSAREWELLLRKHISDNFLDGSEFNRGHAIVFKNTPERRPDELVRSDFAIGLCREDRR